MILPGTYANGFAPRDGEPLFPELWRGCVGAWNPGLGPSGLRLYDWSGRGNHGTLTNMPANDGWKTSQGRHVLDFDGVNDYVEPSLAIGSMRSISLWKSGQGDTTARRLYSLNVNQHSVYIQNNAFRAVYDGADRAGGAVASGWQHVVNQFDGTNHDFYVNGIKLFSTADTANDTAGVISFGRLIPNNIQFWNGELDNIMVYNRALSANEIRLLASRRGIAYEMAPRNWSAQQIAAYRARYYSQLVGGGVI
jgi:hypothetical protein